MPADYRTAAAKRSPQTNSAIAGSHLLEDRTPQPDRRQREVLHRVVDGDTLAALAARYLGDAAFADRIWQANRERLPENPHWLPIGVELQIPPGASQPGSELASVALPDSAETRLVPIAPVSVVADTQAR